MQPAFRDWLAKSCICALPVQATNDRAPGSDSAGRPSVTPCSKLTMGHVVTRSANGSHRLALLSTNATLKFSVVNYITTPR